ncbi:MAG: hypothetical protein Q9220_004480 [cf. Caloplaca sp. 1 TL-2023]
MITSIVIPYGLPDLAAHHRTNRSAALFQRLWLEQVTKRDSTWNNLCQNYKIYCDEIHSIAKKRSGFEHKLNARGSTVSDYARYAEYEMNLDTLRQTRAKRLGIKSKSYLGQRRVFFILDRATRKFHGDAALWLQYLTFARKQKANKKIAQIITDMLRLHPTSPELWIYAAQYALDEMGDVTEARAHMQRGLRFCNRSKHLWSECLKLEMMYIAKISARRRILGLVSRSPSQDQDPNQQDIRRDMVTAPSFDMQDMHLVPLETTANYEEIPADDLASAPALAGAIPIAVFDAAMKEFRNDALLGSKMFDLVAHFVTLKCTRKILQHIIDLLMTTAPNEVASISRFIKAPVIGMGSVCKELPDALMTVIDRFDSSMRGLSLLENGADVSQNRARICRYTIWWIVEFLGDPELDPDIRTVLISIVRAAWDHCLTSVRTKSETSSDETIILLKALRSHGLESLAQKGLACALQTWPEEPGSRGLEASPS